MQNKLSLNLFNELSNHLMNSKFLKKTSIDKHTIKKYIDNHIFQSNIENMIINNDFSCKATLSLCKDFLAELSTETPDNWLYYLYQFTLNKSFPDAITITLDENLEIASLFYLQVLRGVLEFEKKYIPNNLKNGFPLNFLEPNKEENLQISTEYKKFKKAFYNNYVYEMMKLNQEITPHNTLDHISGVHYLAMYISKQLKNKCLPLDIAKISGAAAGHDIGKFGCKGEESKRVPYLHYYYTDVWFKKFNIPNIGHIATNHSTWDLELEILPLESLILIYSDFRVKNQITKNNKYKMHIYTLEEAFTIILNKLDNVDDAKEKRYRRVYAKLLDFENYMLDMNVNVNLKDNTFVQTNTKHYSLMQEHEIIENFKFLAIEHNIHLMYKFRSESSLSSILEIARSENDWKKLRGYLNILEEYSTYLTQKQKLITLNFLYELLIHKEEDIRKQAANLIGVLIALFDEEYRKEIPSDIKLNHFTNSSYTLLDKYIQRFLFPDHKIINKHREWIGYSFRMMIYSLFANCRAEQKNKYREILTKYYKDTTYNDESYYFYLLQAIRYIPFVNIRDNSSTKLYNFIFEMLNHNSSEVRLSSLDRVYYLLFRIDKTDKFINKLKKHFLNNVYPSIVPAENFLRLKIVEKLVLNNNILNQYRRFFENDNKKMSDIFLKNLKTATTWVTKKIHVELLLEQVIENPKEKGIHTSMHLCNLIKVSANENVRNHSGDALLKIFPFLSLDQRNDVAVELLRGLEIQGYQFTKYIPKYLGQILLFLHPVELDEIINDFIEKIKSSNSQINFLLLETIGITIENYPKYETLFIENKEIYNNRLIKMLGILLNGLAHYDLQVKQEAFRVIGVDIFGSKELTLKQKKIIFNLIGKKILTLLPNIEENELLFLNNSASLNHIYRFISNYVFLKGDLFAKHNKKIAFFPGTYDPFSLGHKEIAREIRNLGFEVFLAVDEFSWSKKTQPHLLRRNIINMSIADELNIYLFPEEFPINIANHDNLKTLKNIFKLSNLFIVVGCDVILNASSYKNDFTDHSIHNFSHIVFERKNSFSTEIDNIKLEKALEKINGEVIKLSLPPQYEDISSTQIRNYIDDNRDISNLIDPLAQKFIYEYGIYRRESQYKTLMKTKSINIDVVENITDDLIEKLTSYIFDNNNGSYQSLATLKSKLSSRLIVIHDTESNEILGFSAFHWTRSSMLFSEFQDNHISEFIRENAIGRIIILDGIFTNSKITFENLEQILLTETLSFCLSKDYSYAVFKNIITNYSSSSLYEILELQGFQKIPDSKEDNPTFIVNMSNPCTLDLDIDTIIKEPFKSNINIKKVISRSRKRLQKSLTMLYPGHLVLSFDRNILHQTLINKVCKTNRVPIHQLEPRKLGPYMCVPFGSMLNGYTISNTVTKSMHTEKMFAPDMQNFSIAAHPYYMTLENQIKMIRSFNRPIILVDNLLNKGYRVKAINSMLKIENIEVEKIIVGILSGRGKELMDIQGREVDSAYFIPNLKVWFNETTQYPFIGGDTIWRGSFPEKNLLPSVNFILPFASPKFIKNTSKNALYNLSETSINNALNILTTLEKEYQSIHEKNLTLKHLGEVFISPRYPDQGKDVNYDLNLKPSHYLRNNLEHLERIKNMIMR